jgi:polysaccharide export outer membrane protein
VTVQVLFNGSIRYYLLGQFVDPGLKYADRSMRLLEAMSLGGSVILDKASLRRAYLIREGRRLPVNFRSLLRDGDVRHNIWLRGGDTIVVPDNLNEQAFVLGGAAGGNARGGAVPFVNGAWTCCRRWPRRGIGFRERPRAGCPRCASSAARAIAVSSSWSTPSGCCAGRPAPFELAPGDIVFVPPSGVTTWNEAIQQILPTLQTVSSLLNPFVQIKYLSD